MWEGGFEGRDKPYSERAINMFGSVDGGMKIDVLWWGVVELELFAGGLLWGTTRAQEGQNCRNGVLSVPKQLSTTVLLSNHTRSPLSEFVPMAVFEACEWAQSRAATDATDGLLFVQETSGGGRTASESL